MSEVEMMRQVATDRLVFMRVMEKAVNDIDSIMTGLKRDIMEISQQVAARNQDRTMVEEDDTDDPAED